MEKPRAPPLRQIRAVHDERTVTVYQAYRAAIALPAVEAQRFVPPFSLERMTWIKPSFLWMMHRSGWGRKAGQDHVLAIDVTREGFDWALARACLSHFETGVHGTHEAWRGSLARSPVRVQWDPERSIALGALPYRSLQMGLSGEAARKYAGEWVVNIRNVDGLAATIAAHVERGETAHALRLAPEERPYPVAPDAARSLGMGP